MPSPRKKRKRSETPPPTSRTQCRWYYLYANEFYPGMEGGWVGLVRHHQQISVYQTKMLCEKPPSGPNTGSDRWMQHFNVRTRRWLRSRQTHLTGPLANGSPYCLQSGFTLLSGHWTDKFQDLVLFDKDGNRRQTHKDIVRGFKDDICCAIWPRLSRDNASKATYADFVHDLVYS